jgi:AcrR family transcriptional regulator
MAPRPGLTVDRIVEAAAAIADMEGLERLTLGAVATALGVRTPSLYNHVGGLDDLRRLLTVRGLEELGAALQRAAVGRSGDDAVRAVAEATRAFARARPGLYATTVPTTEVDDEAVREAGTAVLTTVLDALAGYDLDEGAAVHAARTLRAAVHGFVTLELAGGFGLAVAVDDSFTWMTRRLTDALAPARAPAG